jgi:16S rRNA (cytosine967-C5)-methyltransferase
MLNNKLVNLLRELVKELLRFNQPTDKLLSNFFREHKKLSTLERYLIAETVYSLLRNYYKITSLIDKQDILNLLATVWVKILKLDHALVKQVSGLDFTRLEQLEFKDDILSKTELPQWITDRLFKQYSMASGIELALAMQHQAPLDLRVNLIKTDVKSVFKILDEEGLEPKITPWSPFGIRLSNKISLSKHKLFTTGLIEVQDESSQIAGLLLAPRRGEMVVDFCAGSGGKTLLFGMLMRNSGRIYAFDIHERRLNNLAPRLAKSGLSNVHTQLIAHENDSKIKRLHGKIDRVFVDAPCTGLGTLRRNPELKLWQTETGLYEVNLKQLSILSSASKLVKPGGHLVYATCSILASENQGIITQFLTEHPNFKVVPVTQVLNRPELESPDGYLALLPHLHNTDGFFAALFQRIA